MIIHSLHANNCLKYRELALDDLPTSGLIAISGPNESGKTAIPETLCLALFGRTFQLPPEALAKAVLWGETDAQVDVVFSGADGQRYRVHRDLDSEGRQGARLALVEGDETVARGPQSVNTMVAERLGFDYAEFVDAIYLAQKGEAGVQPRAATAGAITGVSALAAVAQGLEQEVGELQEAIMGRGDQLQEAWSRLQALGVSEAAHSADLAYAAEAEVSEAMQAEARASWEGAEARLARLEQALEETRKGLGGVAATARDAPFQQWCERLKTLEQGLATLDELLAEGDYATTVVAPVQGVVARLAPQVRELEALLQQAETFRQHLAARLEHHDSEGEGQPAAAGEAGAEPLPVRAAAVESAWVAARRQRNRRRWAVMLLALPAAAAGGLWYLLFQRPALPLSQRLGDTLAAQVPAWDPALHSQWLLGGAVGLGALALIALFMALAAGGRTRDRADRRDILCAELRDAREQEQGLQLLDAVAPEAALETLEGLGHDSLGEAARDYREGEDRVLLDNEALAEFRDDAEVAAESLADAGAEARASFAEAREHHQVVHDLLGRIAELQSQTAVRQEALGLLTGANRQAMERFNRDLRVFMSRVLPRLTDDRYRYLQVDENLDVQVFSSAKHDFIGWAEISTGTQQQILLTLRLALTAALAEASAGGVGQCVMLDEPFAFYDAQREADTLGTLPQVSDKLNQIWVLSQEFVTTEPFALHLACTRERETLSNG